MEEYLALSYIFKLSTELAKDPALFYQLGYLFGYRGEELILLLLYSRFNYKLAFYFILMSKYFYLSSFPIFTIHLHQHMLTLGMDNYYFDVLRCLNRFVARSLSACTDSFKCSYYSYHTYNRTTKMNSYRDHLWFLLDEWIHDTESICHQYDAQIIFIKERFLDYIVLTVHYTKHSRCKFLIRSIEDLEKVILYLETAILWP